VRYSSLYVRTALYIGGALLTFVIIGAASFALIATMELRGYIKTRHSSLGEEAAVVLQQGEDALVEWMQTEANVPSNVSIYILDASGTDILGRSIPHQYANFINESVLAKAEPDASYQPVRLAPTITAPDGSQYVFLVIPRGISPWGNTTTVAGVLAVALLVIASVAWLIARTITRPVNQLQLAVQELAAGNISASVPRAVAERDDEIGRLAADFNLMAGQLQQLLEGRERLYQEMSHELRSPLARLQAAIELASEREGSNTDKQIEQEISRMNQAIGDMLRYASLNAIATPTKQLVRINRQLQDIVDSEQVEAEKQHCTLHLASEKGLNVLGDPDLLNSAFENIIRNAIRHTRNDTIVQITAQKAGSNVVVTISDNGNGVPEEDLPQLFEPYFKAGNARQTTNSSGLGLAIVKRVIDHHEGTVGATSNNGLKITITLPVAELS